MRARGLGGRDMATISGRALSIFKDACGIHEFSDEEQARIEVLAEQLRQIMQASKQREQQRPKTS